jgi:hypothetical protein
MTNSTAHPAPRVDPWRLDRFTDAVLAAELDRRLRMVEVHGTRSQVPLDDVVNRAVWFTT